MYRICIKEHFDAAHSLDGYNGDCGRLHGHRWIVEVFLLFDKLNEIGLAIDFKDVKAYLRDILPDHKYLNGICDFNPTAENLACYLYYEIKTKFKNTEKVRIWESPDCYAEFTDSA